MAVLDGNNLNTWQPWGVPFAQVKQVCETLEARPPSEYVELFKVTLFSDELDASLKTRKNWNSVVGVIVDTMGVTDQKVTLHQDFCRTLLKAKSPLFKKAGYYLILLATDPSTAAERTLMEQLESDAQGFFQNYAETPQEVSNLEMLRAHIRFCARTIMRRHPLLDKDEAS